jgi:hypothetical protein
MTLPSSVESVGLLSFIYCRALSSLSFASPSHLRELLDLPPWLSGLVSIPDSVEVLSFCPQTRLKGHRTLAF